MGKRLILALFTVTLTFFAQAAIETYEFKTVEQEQQFRELTNQLRCPKCQNNNIADSNAPIATDMREKVYELMQQGRSQQDIINYMIDRYGHFVTYQPPVTPATIILWVLPALCVVGGAVLLFMLSRRRKNSELAAEAAEFERLSTEEQTRLQQLLRENNNRSGRSAS